MKPRRAKFCANCCFPRPKLMPSENSAKNFCPLFPSWWPNAPRRKKQPPQEQVRNLEAPVKKISLIAIPQLLYSLPWKSGPEGVQFHDILYKTFRDILYTSPAEAGRGSATTTGRVWSGSISHTKVRR